MGFVISLFVACLPFYFLFQTHCTSLKQQLKQGIETDIWVHLRKRISNIIDMIFQLEGIF